MAMPTPRLNRKRFALVKQEDVKGVDAKPTSVNGVYLESLTVKKMDTKAIDRNSIRPFLGGGGKIISSYEGSIEMEIALAIGGDENGVPTPGITPAWDALMQGCGVGSYSSASMITDALQDGTNNTLTLSSSASSIDDIYCGTSISVSFMGDKTCASGTQDGLSITLNSADASLSSSDDLNGLSMLLKQTTITLATQPNGVSLRRKNIVLPKTTNYIDSTSLKVLVGCLVKVSTTAGAVIHNDIRKIVGASALKNSSTEFILTFDSPLSTLPIANTKVELIEQRFIKAVDVSSKKIEFTQALAFPATSTTVYGLAERRLIINYDGTTKVATVSKAFKKTPSSGLPYSINPFVRYYPISTNFRSNTIYYYEDGSLHTFTQAMGTFTLEFSTGQLPTAKFSYTGIIDRYEDTAMPVYDVSTWVNPLPINYSNTKDLIIGDYSNTVTDKMSFDAGNEVVHTNCPGYEAIYIKDRSAKGSISIWSPKKAEIDFYELIKTGRKTVFAFTHGPIGNQIAFFAQSVQLSNPSDSEKDGVQMLSLDLNMVPDTEGGDWQLILQ